ncbi:MAG: sialidase family protein [Acidimicrobiia bacterium]
MRRAAAVLAASAVGTLAAVGTAPAAEPPTLTRPVQASVADQDPGRLYSSPAFAVDPEDPLRIVAGFADLRTRRCGILRSLDGGKSWTRPDGAPGTAAYPFCSQSQGGVIQAPVAFGGDGVLYMALGGWGEEEASRVGGAVLVARSSDLGDNWDTTVVRTARGKSGNEAENIRPVQSIAVEPKGGGDDVVYVTFSRTLTGFTAPNAVPSAAMVAVSRDGGRTFGEAVDLVGKLFEPQALRDQALSAVTTTTAPPNATTTTTTIPPADSKAANPNQAANFGAAGSRNGMVVRVDGDGDAYVLWPTGTANIANAPPPGMALSKSIDGGRTWQTKLSIPFDYLNSRGGPANAYQQLAVTREGTLHIVYNQTDNPDLAGHSNVYHRASYDGGETWTEAKDLGDDDPKLFAGQYFPNLSIAPSGRVDVVWWDTRDTPGMRSTDVYYSYSTDDGRTWAKNQRITDQSVDRRLGVWGLNYDIASQPGVSSVDEYAVIGWDDTRNSDPDTKARADLGGGLQDLYVAAAQFEAVGGGASRAGKIVLAGIAGLVAVGLLLLLAALATKRRAPAESPRSPGIKVPSPARG